MRKALWCLNARRASNPNHVPMCLPYLRKRAGHLQSKGRYQAAQLLAMVESGLWIDNARAANAAAAVIAKAAGKRLLHPVEANEVFMALTRDEATRLRAASGFDFYDWGVFDAAGNGAARFRYQLAARRRAISPPLRLLSLALKGEA